MVPGNPGSRTRNPIGRSWLLGNPSRAAEARTGKWGKWGDRGDVSGQGSQALGVPGMSPALEGERGECS